MNARRIGAVLTGGILAASLVACGSPSSQEPDGDVEADEAGIADDPQFVWAVTGADRDAHQAVAELWNETHPDTQVEVAFLAPTADEQRQAMFQDLQSRAGEFDVLGLDVVWAGEFADNGYIRSLEDYRGDVEGSNLPGAVASAEWQNELFALPYSSNGGFLYYRSDLVDGPPSSWDDLLETGASVGEENGIGGYVGLGNQYEGFVVSFLQLFWSAGGELFNDAQDASTFLEGDAAERALNFYIDGREQGLFADGFDSMVEDDARAIFQAGESVYMHNWPYAIPLMNDESDSAVAGNFEVAPLPSFTEGEDGISALGGLNNAVSELSENPELAEEFVVWAATDPDAQATLIEHSIPATLLSAYDGLGDPDMELLGDVLANAKARPAVPGYNSLSLVMQENLHGAFLGQIDPETALEAIDQAANDALSGE